MTTSTRTCLVSVAAAGALVLPAVAGAGGGRTIDWQAVEPISGSVDGEAVRITGSAAPHSYPLVIVDRPGVSDRYAVEGRVRYADVEGAGFLELWSVFADGSRYFTRTWPRPGRCRR